jgi:hypothetical protein
MIMKNQKLFTMNNKIFNTMERLVFSTGRGITILAVILGILMVGNIVIRLIF